MKKIFLSLVFLCFVNSIFAAQVMITTQIEWNTYISNLTILNIIPTTDTVNISVVVNLDVGTNRVNNGDIVVSSGTTFDVNGNFTNNGTMTIIGAYDGFGNTTNTGTIIVTGSFIQVGNYLGTGDLFSCNTSTPSSSVPPVGTPCNDGDATTTMDSIDVNCNCVGMLAAPMGACCLPDGSCITSTEGDCMTMVGDYAGDDSTCPPTTTTFYEDVDGDGYYSGTTMDTDCPPDGFVPIGSIIDVNVEDCDDTMASITIPGSSCDDGNPNTVNDTLNMACMCVGEPTGACCLPDGSCTVTTAGECTGTYHGDDVPCAAETTFYEDVDGDGYPSGNTIIASCQPTTPPGYRPADQITDIDALDCDDSTGDITIPGTSCDDGDDLTGGDFYNENCECVGGFVIPTLSQWGIIVLSMMMLIFGVVFVRIRKRDQIVVTE